MDRKSIASNQEETPLDMIRLNLENTIKQYEGLVQDAETDVDKKNLQMLLDTLKT